MPVDALKQACIRRLAIGVVISWTRSDGRRLRIYASDARMDTLTPDSRPYYPVMVQHDDIIIAGSETSFAIVLAMDGQYAVEVYPGYTYEQYDGLAAVLRKYPELLQSATATMVCEGHADDLSVTWKELAVAAIESVINTTAQSMSFSCTLMDDGENRDMPVRETSLNAMAADEEAFEDSKGTVIPVAFGDFEPHTRWAFTAQPWLKYWCGLFGWKIPVATAVPTGRWMTNSTEIRSAYSERITGSLAITPTPYPGVYLDIGGRLARLYDRWFDQAGASHPGWDGALSTKPQFYGVKCNERPYVQVLVRPTPVSGGGASKLARAVDDDPTTYATLTDGGVAKFALPTVSLPGRLSMNSTDAGANAPDDDPVVYPLDYEGTARPVGLKVFALFANPGAVPISGYVRLRMAFDDDVTYLPESPHSPTVDASATLAPNEALLVQVNVPFLTHVLREGWCGTRWQRGDFTAGQSSDTSDPDCPVYHEGSEGYPMRIIFENHMGATIALPAVGLWAGVRANTPVSVSKVDNHDPEMRGGWWKHLREWLKPTVDLGLSDVFNPDNITRRWGTQLDPNGIRHELERVRIASKPTAESLIRVATAMHADDSAGKYTGTPSKTLTQAIEMSRAATQIYGGVVDSLICSGTELGSYEIARAAVCDWYSGGVSDLDWQIVSQLLSKTRVKGYANGILSNCLGMKRVRYPNGKYGWYQWGPVTALHASRLYQSGTPIDPEQMLLMQGTPDDPKASPLIRVGHTGRSSVINSIRVYYRGELQATASCDWDGSTDGDLEAEWPALPYSYGLLPGGTGGLCDISRGRFGQSPRPFPVDFSETYVPEVAMAEGMYQLARHWQPEPVLEMLAGLGLYDLWEGHVFRLSNAVAAKIGLQPPFWGESDWESLYWMCVSNVIQGDGLSETCMVKAIWLPQVIGPVGRGGAFAGDEEEILLAEGS